MYKVPFVGYKENYKRIGKETIKEIIRCVKDGEFILRKDVELFEKNIAKYVGTKYAVSVGSGTDSLIFSLKAAGIQAGDEVIVPGHTFWATAEAVLHVGAKPILVDISLDDLLINISEIEKSITNKTRAIIPVHLNGVMCNMKEIMRIVKKHKLIVIEDACQSLGCKDSRGKKTGSFGLTGCFSLYPAKMLGSYGDGGFVTTNSLKIANKVRQLRNHGMYGLNKETHDVGWTSCLDNLQAAVLNVKLKYLDRDIKRRQEIACMYNSSDIVNFSYSTSPNNVYQNYIILAYDRNALYEYLKKRGIETLKNEYSFMLEKPKNSQLVEKYGLRLPLYPEMTNTQVNHVIKIVNEFLTR